MEVVASATTTRFFFFSGIGGSCIDVSLQPTTVHINHLLQTYFFTKISCRHYWGGLSFLPHETTSPLPRPLRLSLLGALPSLPSGDLTSGETGKDLACVDILVL
jgi:hypothetical protein